MNIDNLDLFEDKIEKVVSTLGKLREEKADLSKQCTELTERLRSLEAEREELARENTLLRQRESDTLQKQAEKESEVKQRLATLLEKLSALEEAQT